MADNQMNNGGNSTGPSNNVNEGYQSNNLNQYQSRTQQGQAVGPDGKPNTNNPNGENDLGTKAVKAYRRDKQDKIIRESKGLEKGAKVNVTDAERTALTDGKMGGAEGGAKDKVAAAAINKADEIGEKIIPDKIGDARSNSEKKADKEALKTTGHFAEKNIEAGTGKKKEINMTSKEKEEAMKNGGVSTEDSSTKKLVRTAGRGVAAYATGGQSLGKDQMVVNSKTGDKLIGVVADQLDKAPGVEKVAKAVDDVGVTDAAEGVMDIVGSVKNKDKDSLKKGVKKTAKGAGKLIKAAVISTLITIGSTILLIMCSIIAVIAVAAPILGLFMDLTSGDEDGVDIYESAPEGEIYTGEVSIGGYGCGDGTEGGYPSGGTGDGGGSAIPISSSCSCSSGCGLSSASNLVSQGDFKGVVWKTGGDTTIDASGCSLVSVMNAGKAIGVNVDVGSATAYTKSLGISTASWASVVKPLANKYNMSVTFLWDNKGGNSNTRINDINGKINKVKEALASGMSVILSGQRPAGDCDANSGGCAFTPGGHYLAIVGITSDNRVIVGNPAKGSKSGTGWKFPAVNVLKYADIAAAISKKGSGATLGSCNSGGTAETTPGSETSTPESGINPSISTIENCNVEIGDYPIESSSSSGDILSEPLSEFLKKHGSSLEQFNQTISSNVRSNGCGTRAGVVAAAVTMIGEIAKYDGKKMPYFWGGGHEGKTEKNPFANGEWGSNKCSTFANNIHYNRCGLDCSGFVSWALYNGGFKMVYKTASGFVGLGNRVPLSSSQPVVAAGDLLASDGHVMLVVGVDTAGKKYKVAEAKGNDYGIVFSTVSYSVRDGYYGVNMSSFYNNASNKRGVCAV